MFIARLFKASSLKKKNEYENCNGSDAGEDGSDAGEDGSDAGEDGSDAGENGSDFNF